MIHHLPKPLLGHLGGSLPNNYVKDYSEVNETPGVGFTKVYGHGAVTNSLGNPVLGTNTTASKQGVLFTQSPKFGLHADKVTYHGY